MATPICVICGESGTGSKCSTCKSVHYCSQKCQTVDWPLHKNLCKKFAKLPPRPTPDAKLGILLPADDPQPRLVWISCPKVSNGQTKFDQPVVHHLLGEGISNALQVERLNALKNEVRGYTLDHALVLHVRDNWLNDGSKPNQAALALTDWKLPYDWRGNIVVMSYKGTATIEQQYQTHPTAASIAYKPHVEGGTLEPFQDYQDVTVADLRVTVDYLMTYGVKIKRGQEHSSLLNSTVTRNRIISKVGDLSSNGDEKKIKGVLIRCKGEIQHNRGLTGKWERYSEVMVSQDHPVWDSTPTEASVIMGGPLLTYRIDPNPMWKKLDFSNLDNQPATFLNIRIDPNRGPTWTLADPEWQNDVGSVLLVRKDQKDLSREQGWALAEFMQFRVMDALEDACQSGDVKKRREAILKWLSWTRFDSFLNNFKSEMTAADATRHKSWDNVKSPFGTMEYGN